MENWDSGVLEAVKGAKTFEMFARRLGLWKDRDPQIVDGRIGTYLREIYLMGGPQFQNLEELYHYAINKTRRLDAAYKQFRKDLEE